jgi:vitamin B12 transporter
MQKSVFFKRTLLASSLAVLSTPAVLYADQSEEIVISASRVEVARESAGSSVTVLDADYLEKNQIQSVSDVLRNVPGLAMSRSGGVGTSTSVRIRGAEANQTLVLIDGIEVNDIASGSEFDFADLLNLDVERVEVLRGAQSALWGSDAMGGVISITTKQGKGALNGRVNLEQGSFGTQQQSFNINAGSDAYHFSLSGVLLDTDGISAFNEHLGFTEEDGYDNASVNFKGGFQATENLSVDVVFRHLEADIETDSVTFGVGPVDSNDSSETRQKFAKVAANLSLLDGQWLHKVALSKNDTSNEFLGGFPFLSEGEKEKIEYQTDFFLNSEMLEQRLTFATEREKDEFFSQSDFSTVDREMEVSSYVLEYGVNVNDKLFATLAGRRDNNSEFNNADTYRMTLAGWLADNVRAHASKGTGIKNPTFFELFGSTATFTGNADLRPEENTSWDLGGEFHFESVDGYLDLTYFHTEVNNLIVGTAIDAANLPSDSRIKGVELSAVFNPSKNLQISASYTYSDTDDGNGNKLVRRAKHIASVNGSYLFPNAKTRVTGGVQYNGKQTDVVFDEFFARLPDVTLSGYTLVNLALSHHVSEQLELFARVDNLLNEKYEDVFGFGTKGVGATVGITLRGGL